MTYNIIVEEAFIYFPNSIGSFNSYKKNARISLAFKRSMKMGKEDINSAK